MAQKYRVIDADAHVNPPVDFWKDYLPRHLRDKAPRFEQGTATDQTDFVVFEGQRTPFTRVNSQAGTKPEDQKATGKLSETRPGAWEPKARLQDMDMDGVDAAAIFGGGPLAASDPELYLASFHAYNQWLADFCAQAPDRLFGMPYLPMFDVEQSIGEVKWAKEKKMKGVVIPPYAMPAGGSTGGGLNASTLIIFAEAGGARSYADPEFEPFWRTCEELDMPVHMHLGAARNPTNLRPGADDRFRGQMRTKLAMAEVIVHFVMTGIIPKHPKLKLVSVESGVGWLAFCAEYLDNTWQKHRYSTKSPIMVEPSTYFDQVYGTFLEDRAAVNNRNLKGAKNIMWSSDYPHSETTWPNSKGAIERSFAGIPAKDKDMLISGTARELYKLG